MDSPVHHGIVGDDGDDENRQLKGGNQFLFFMMREGMGKNGSIMDFLLFRLKILKMFCEKLNLCRDSSNYHKELHFCEITEEKCSNKIRLAGEMLC